MYCPRPHLWGGSLIFLALFLGGCDIPTESPNVRTKTQLSVPLIADKTVRFLGGPESKEDPLIDTTGSAFDSLFTVAEADQTIFVEQEVNDFEVGALDEALDEASDGVGLDTMFAESVIARSNIRTQSVRAAYERTNGIFVSPGRRSKARVPPTGAEDTVRVGVAASDLVEPPTTDVVDASGATVESVTFTGESVNEITVELSNGRTNPSILTNGSGEAPAIRLESANGVVDAKQFSSPISPGTSGRLSLDVGGATIGEGAALVLTIDGIRSADVLLATDTSPELRYRRAELGNPRAIEVEASASGVNAQGQTASRFAGVEVQSGNLDVTIRNNLSFDITIDTLAVENTAGVLGPLPRDFPRLGISTMSFPEIAAGTDERRTFDLSGAGVARRVDATLTGHASTSKRTVTLRAAGGVRASGRSTMALSTMHFWPQGERVTSSGAFAFEQDRIDFTQPGDYVELASGRIRLRKLDNELGVTFESFTLSYPNLRRPDANGDGLRYAPGDSLEIRFVADHEGDPFAFPRIKADTPSRTNEASISDLRLLPTRNQVEYHLSGTMETVPDTTERYLRTIHLDDEVRSNVDIGQLDVRAVKGRVNSFAVNVTTDANGDGRLDVGRDAEAQTASFEGLGGIASQVDGVQLRGSEFTMSFETDVGADARFVAAIQGEHDDGRLFLSGEGHRAVDPRDPARNGFLNNGRPVAPEKLIQFDVEGAPSTDPVARSVTLNETNSNVDAFISRLPDRVRLAGKARIEEGRVRLRRPVTFNAGLNARVPLSFAGSFSYRDTLDADLGDLSQITDPDTTDVTITAAILTVEYANAIPIGFDVALTFVDENGEDAVSIPGAGEALRVKPAPKTEAGTAASSREGQLAVELTGEEVRSLADGRTARLSLTLDQQEQGPPVRVRADDALQLSLSADIDGTAQFN